MLEAIKLEHEMVIYQARESRAKGPTYQGKQGIDRFSRMSMARKRALVEELRKKYGPLQT
jgi:hypothetical protein